MGLEVCGELQSFIHLCIHSINKVISVSYQLAAQVSRLRNLCTLRYYDEAWPIGQV